MLSSRDPMIPSGEQNLDGEPPWDGRGSAGPDGRGYNSAKPVEQGTDDLLYEVVMLPNPVLTALHLHHYRCADDLARNTSRPYAGDHRRQRIVHDGLITSCNPDGFGLMKIVDGHNFGRQFRQFSQINLSWLSGSTFLINSLLLPLLIPALFSTRMAQPTRPAARTLPTSPMHH